MLFQIMKKNLARFHAMNYCGRHFFHSQELKYKVSVKLL